MMSLANVTLDRHYGTDQGGYYGEKRAYKLRQAQRNRLRLRIMRVCPRLSVEEVRVLVDAIQPMLDPIVLMM